jgi:2-octaprenyl-6-methoxyphenol hydroxylase
MHQTDIFISGAGIAGLTAALALAQAGFRVTVADPTPPVADGADDGSDLRSTAYLQPSQALFARLGLWDRLAALATPLDVLRIVDTAGDPPVLRDTRDFRASDLGDQPFGWNVLNWVMRRELTAAAQAHPGVDLRLGVGFAGLVQRTTAALVTLTDGTRLSARLAVAADGRDSPLRDAAGIGARVTRYGQVSLAFVATHDVPHANVSTEVYHEGGPFTMVPLPDVDGRPASAIVWMNPGAKAAAFARLPTEELGAIMTARSAHVLGPLAVASPIRQWPIVIMRADRLTGERVAVIAEAAHVMPPIGAQGLNTSLADVAALADIVARAPGDLGTPSMLHAYARARTGDIHARAAVIDLFNRVVGSGAAPMQAARLMGLRAVHGIAPVRQAVMRAGLGGRGPAAADQPAKAAP